MSLRIFTSEELSRYNGLHGMPVYVACCGRVYDFSSSFLWRGGAHQVLHYAGSDLTAALSQAPHGEELLARYPIVGVLALDPDSLEESTQVL
jgi:predicted heme/steroid binding protein